MFVYFLCSLEQLLDCVNPSGHWRKKLALTAKACLWDMAEAPKKKRIGRHPPQAIAEGLEFYKFIHSDPT